MEELQQYGYIFIMQFLIFKILYEKLGSRFFHYFVIKNISLFVCARSSERSFERK